MSDPEELRAILQPMDGETLADAARRLKQADAFTRLVRAVRRLRSTPRCPTMRFGFTASELVLALRRELEEFEEAAGAARFDEAGDVLALAVNFGLSLAGSHPGARPHLSDLMYGAAAKIHRRLDDMAATGGTWEDAKAWERQNDARPRQAGDGSFEATLALVERTAKGVQPAPAPACRCPPCDGGCLSEPTQPWEPPVPEVPTERAVARVTRVAEREIPPVTEAASMGGTPEIETWQDDAALVRRAVDACRGRHGRMARAFHLNYVFGLGSGFSRKLCERLGLDPDEVVGHEVEPEPVETEPKSGTPEPLQQWAAGTAPTLTESEWREVQAVLDYYARVPGVAGYSARGNWVSEYAGPWAVEDRAAALMAARGAPEPPSAPTEPERLAHILGARLPDGEAYARLRVWMHTAEARDRFPTEAARDAYLEGWREARGSAPAAERDYQRARAEGYEVACGRVWRQDPELAAALRSVSVMAKDTAMPGPSAPQGGPDRLTADRVRILNALDTTKHALARVGAGVTYEGAHVRGWLEIIHQCLVMTEEAALACSDRAYREGYRPAVTSHGEPTDSTGEQRLREHKTTESLRAHRWWREIVGTAPVLAAWDRADLSEGQAAAMLGLDRVSARQALDEWRAGQAPHAAGAPAATPAAAAFPTRPPFDPEDPPTDDEQRSYAIRVLSWALERASIDLPEDDQRTLRWALGWIGDPPTGDRLEHWRDWAALYDPYPEEPPRHDNERRARVNWWIEMLEGSRPREGKLAMTSPPGVAPQERPAPTAPPPVPAMTAPTCPAGGSCSESVACMKAGGCTREDAPRAIDKAARDVADREAGGAG